MLYILLLIFIGVYWIMPLPIQIILLIANAFVPDMIPVIDELLMIIAIVNRIKKYVAIRNFIRVHKILTIFIFVAVVIGIIFGIQWLLKII